MITHELPTTELETKGLGGLLAKVNRALNIDKSNLAHWVHHYARPLGFVSGVGPEWRPKFIDGGFVPLVVRHDSTEDAPVIPEARYLESNIDIAAIRDYIAGEANQALAELDIPLTVRVQSDQAGGGGAKMASGVSIAAQDADLITYAKRRQPLFELHESRLASLVCRIGASQPARLGSLASALLKVAADPSLRIAWPEPSIDLPGQDRDQNDEWELDHLLTDEIELLMRRRGLNESEAVEEFRKIQARKSLAIQIASEARATTKSDVPAAEPSDGSFSGQSAMDMGVSGRVSSPLIAPEQAVAPVVSATVAIEPNETLPSVLLLLPSTSGSDSLGTES
jgi:hypothetical protein